MVTQKMFIETFLLGTHSIHLNLMDKKKLYFTLLSSPELKAMWRVISIPMTPSARLSTFSNISETKRPIELKFSYGVSLGWGNKSLFKWSWSHDRDGLMVSEQITF